MANRKISDLTALTAPATGDLLPIVDISEAAAADKNKKITYGELLASAPAGSAAAPSFSFEGDSNTGIYSPGADQVAISTSGTGRLFVDASGNVGVGTASPSSIAHFAGSGSQAILLQSTNGNTAGLQLLSSGVAAWQIDNTSGNLIFTKDGGELARISSAGRLGLGTTAPDQKLTVAGSIRIVDNNALIFQQNAGVAVGTISMRNSAGVQKAAVASYYNVADEGALEFIGPTGSTNMLLTSAGRLGIGTTSPGSALEINAAAATSPFIAKINTAEAARIDSSGRLLVGTSTSRNAGDASPSLFQIEDTNFASLSIISNRNDVGCGAIKLGKSRGTSNGSNTLVTNGDFLGALIFAGANGTNLQTPGAYIQAAVDGTASSTSMPGRLTFSTTADGASSPTERMRIGNNGNIGIGAANAGNARFYVVGVDATASNFACLVKNSASTDLFYILNDGTFSTGAAASSPYNNTTATAANTVVTSLGVLQRSTSSIKYKTNVETLQDFYADAVLDIRPVWYQSTCKADNPEWGHWGFIAEEVAQVDPRLCFFKEEEDGTLEPESVQYDRFVPHLLNLIKRQQKAIQTLEAKVAALEGA